MFVSQTLSLLHFVIEIIVGARIAVNLNSLNHLTVRVHRARLYERARKQITSMSYTGRAYNVV